MKILHIITRLIVGGAQENTLLTCEGLHARGHDVLLLTGPSPGPEGSLMTRAHSAGFEVRVTPHLVRNPHPWHDHFAYHGLKKLIRTWQPDVVHTHSSKAGILGRAAAWNAVKRPKHPRLKSQDSGLVPPLVIHTIHGLPFHPYQSAFVNKLWIAAEHFAAKRCHHIITVADAMTRQALAAGVGTPDLYTTVYSAMDTHPFLTPATTRDQVRTRYRIPPGAFVYATIARLQPLKGHDDLLTHASTLFQHVPNAHLLWIGDGIYRTRFEQLLKDKGWSHRVTLTGLVPPTEVPNLLPAADALVHPSYREGLARALPQALLAGVPVISYDCDGAAEVCLENQTGFLVKTGDAPALIQAMIRMAVDPAKARAMGAAGRELCRVRFAADTMVTGIENVYKRFLPTA